MNVLNSESVGHLSLERDTNRNIIILCVKNNELTRKNDKAETKIIVTFSTYDTSCETLINQEACIVTGYYENWWLL